MVTRRETTGGITQTTVRGRTVRGGERKGLIAMPGDTNDDTYYNAGFNVLTPSMVNLIEGLGIVMASTTQTTSWGNDAKVANMATLRTNCQSSGYFASGKVHLLGLSAGGASCLRFAKANPSLVQSISLIIPTVDLQEIYDGNLGGFQAEISTAYGGRPADASNPADNTASFTGFPMKIWYSTDDSITPAATMSAFATATGATLVSMGAIGHLWGAPFTGESLAAFIAANDA